VKRIKQLAVAVCLLCGLAGVSLAAPDLPANVPVFPKTLINARYVYVTSYDGNEFNPNLFPEDRQAIAAVESALKQWGRYAIVLRPRDADMIIAVQSRPSEDVLAVYDPRMHGSTYLWRAMGRGGLQQGETPLVIELRHAVEKAGN
jgi:hypothetical protein